MVSETLLAALVVPVFGLVAWVVRRAFGILINRIERSVAESVQQSIRQSDVDRREEHERVWRTLHSNWELSREIATALRDSNGPLDDVDIDIPEHPYERRFEGQGQDDEE